MDSPKPARLSGTNSPRLRRVVGWSIACAVLIFLSIGSASADTYDCFPLCKPEPPSTLAPEGKSANTTMSPSECAPPQGMTMKGAIEQAEALNEQIKPIKEIVGYVNSPQSLAMKLINDYVVKIPAWIGFVMDPVGTLKNRAIGEARDYAKSELKKSVGADAASESGKARDSPATEACPPAPTVPSPQPSAPSSR